MADLVEQYYHLINRILLMKSQFCSFQDTCVALQALSEYATLAYVGHVNLTISLAYSSMANVVEQYYHLNNENSQVLQVIEVKGTLC